MSNNSVNWLLFIVLSLIWGSSFILIKTGIETLSVMQVASLRIVSAGLVLLPITIRHIRRIPANRIGYMFLSGMLGGLIPSYLFCLAETRVDSALAGTLNALTPIFAIITGYLIFRLPVPAKKITGIVIAFAGCLILLFSKGINGNGDISYSLLIVLATFFYGINVNMVKKYLNDIGSIKTASVALSLSAIPALTVLILTGYFRIFTNAATFSGTLASCVLGIFGTAIATILFYMLIKRAGVIFSSMTTYGIPFVAIGWGLVYNEDIGWKQLIALLVILTGVYVANRMGDEKATARIATVKS